MTENWSGPMAFGLGENGETVTKEQATKAEPFVVDELRKKADLYLERNKIYGDNYRRFGPILSLVLAGQTLDPNDPDQMNRLGLLVQVVAKITRYGENFTRGGHDDSLDDNAVYSMMLKEIDTEIRRRAAMTARFNSSKNPLADGEASPNEARAERALPELPREFRSKGVEAVTKAVTPDMLPQNEVTSFVYDPREGTKVIRSVHDDAVNAYDPREK